MTKSQVDALSREAIALIVARWAVARLPNSVITGSPTNGRHGTLEYIGMNSIVCYVSHLLAIKIVGTLLGRVGVPSPWVAFRCWLLPGPARGLCWR